MKAAWYWLQYLRDPLAAYEVLHRDFGDTVCLPFSPNRKFFLLSRPEQAEHVLVTHQDKYVKSFLFRPLKAFLGDGLLTSEGASWQRHRHLVGPAFSYRNVQSFTQAITATTREGVARWEPGSRLDLAEELRVLTINVIGRVLFGTELGGDAGRVGHAVSRLQSAMVVASLMPSFGSAQRLRWLATHTIPGLGQAWAMLSSLVAGIVDARIEAPHAKPADVLDLLLAAGGGQEQRLSREEICDEVMILLLAGHETTTNTLTWALMLLSQHPPAHDRLAAEVDVVLGDREPQASDVDLLPWTQAVVAEAIRLYPPGWTIHRDALVADDIGGIRVTRGDTVAVSPYLMHRSSEFWSQPTAFDPRRFLPEDTKTRPRHAYLPFGAGRRICVGAGLARLETTLMLAMLVKSVRFDLIPGRVVRPRADVSLRPNGPVLVTVATPNGQAPRPMGT